jgi:protein-S-isoprenylcysteine O-methyltransferase Ste14
MRTISYHTLAAGGASDRCVKMEVVLMRHANRTPANRRLLAALSTMLVVVFVVVLAAFVVVGPGRAIGWIVTYFIPVGVILGVVIAVLALLVWALKRLPTPPYRDWWQ